MFELTSNVFFLLYKHTDDGVFDDFLKISDHFPKIFQNCSEGQTNVPEHFPRISEDVRRFPEIAKDSWGRPEDVLIDTPTKLSTI